MFDDYDKNINVGDIFCLSNLKSECFYVLNTDNSTNDLFTVAPLNVGPSDGTYNKIEPDICIAIDIKDLDYNVLIIMLHLLLQDLITGMTITLMIILHYHNMVLHILL